MGDIESARVPSERIGDRDRETALVRLRQHCTAGLLTLDEFSDRTAAVLKARTRGDLDAVVGDLPAVAAADEGRVDSGVRRVVALFGSNRRRARWQLASRVSGVAVLGTSWLDLRKAKLHEGRVTIRAVALLGTVKVIVPEGVGVELTGFSLFGAQTDRAVAEPLPGAPVVTVRALPVFGSVRVVNRPPGERPPVEEGAEQRSQADGQP